MGSHVFSMVPKANIQRSSFDRSHTWKGTFDAGKLIPFLVDEVLPGDTFNLNVNMLCRLATPIVPFMDNVYLDTFFFFVPNRLVWNNWQKFMGEREDPDDSIDYLIPCVRASSTSTANNSAGSCFDYCGIPIGNNLIGGSTGLKINALPFRGICLIWNEFFRDENLQDSIKINKTDSNTITVGAFNGNEMAGFDKAGSCLPRNKRHDYFTSALPWPQRGDSVDIPLGTSAPVFAGSSRHSDVPVDVMTFSAIGAGGANVPYNTDASLGIVSNGTNGVLAADPFNPLGGGPNPAVVPDNLYADLTQATAATINTLRQAFQVQRLLETDARSGTRYTEILQAHFGVISPDARLQRPEYLGGSSTPFIINPVAQTASTDSTSPQGNLAAFGMAGYHGHGFVKSFVEHGYLIGFVSIRADLTYQQGLNRMWSRQTRYDFYWPTLAHLGEQAVFNKEIYAQGNSYDDEVFGYQERYAEYRYFPNLITGQLRSTYSAPLDIWHLAQKFDSLPTLSSDFIIENPPIDRVIATPDEPQFIMDVFFKMNCVRPMPLYGVPGLIDHF